MEPTTPTRKFLRTMSEKATRSNAAHCMMISSVILTSAGTWLISAKYGLITAGVTSGVYGYLLGSE